MIEKIPTTNETTDSHSIFMLLFIAFSASIKIFRVRIWLERASKKRQYHNNSYTSSQYALIFAEKFAIIIKKRASIILFDARF